jgi:hypothetical protein
LVVGGGAARHGDLTIVPPTYFLPEQQKSRRFGRDRFLLTLSVYQAGGGAAGQASSPSPRRRPFVPRSPCSSDTVEQAAEPVERAKVGPVERAKVGPVERAKAEQSAAQPGLVAPPPGWRERRSWPWWRGNRGRGTGRPGHGRREPRQRGARRERRRGRGQRRAGAGGRGQGASRASAARPPRRSGALPPGPLVAPASCAAAGRPVGTALAMPNPDAPRAAPRRQRHHGPCQARSHRRAAAGPAAAAQAAPAAAAA